MYVHAHTHNIHMDINEYAFKQMKGWKLATLVQKSKYLCYIYPNNTSSRL